MAINASDLFVLRDWRTQMAELASTQEAAFRLFETAGRVIVASDSGTLTDNGERSFATNPTDVDLATLTETASAVAAAVGATTVVPRLGNTVAMTVNDGTTSGSLSYTPDPGSANRIVLCLLGLADPPETGLASAPTWGGNPMTLLASVVTGAPFSMRLYWYGVTNPSGTATLSITKGLNQVVAAAVTTLLDPQPVTPLRTVATASANFSGEPAATADSVSGDLTFGVALAGSDQGITPDVGTERLEVENDSTSGVSLYRITLNLITLTAGGATTLHDWSLSGGASSAPWRAAAAAVIQAPASVVPDTGTLAETASVSQAGGTPTAVESATLADGRTQLAIQGVGAGLGTLADNGALNDDTKTGSDTATLTEFTQLVSPSGLENVNLNDETSQVDTSLDGPDGTLSEGFVLAAALARSDTAVCVDSGALVIDFQGITGQDTADLSETTALQVDSSVLQVSVAGTDSATLADDLFTLAISSLLGPDTAVLSEAFDLAATGAQPSASDSGALAELWLVEVEVVAADTVTAVEASGQDIEVVEFDAAALAEPDSQLLDVVAAVSETGTLVEGTIVDGGYNGTAIGTVSIAPSVTASVTIDPALAGRVRLIVTRE